MYILLKFQKDKEIDLNTLTIEEEDLLIRDKNYLVFQDEDKELFKKLNFEGYNVYKTLNTFRNNRRTFDNIDKFQKILIDFDSNDFEEYLQLVKKLNQLKKKLKIEPTEILKTYKGYHYIFSLSKELEYMSIEQYKNISNFLVNALKGDKKALQVNGIYKVPGYFDKKNNRNFLIENISNNNKNGLITQKFVQTITGEKLSSRENQINHQKEKKENQLEMTKNYKNAINSLNFYDVIHPKLLDAGYHIGIDINGKINGTNGISVSSDGFVNDFSHGKNSGENRANGNYNFLLNYVFNGDFTEFSIFCSKYLGIKRVGKGKVGISNQIIKGITNQKLEVAEEGKQSAISFGKDYIEIQETIKVLKEENNDFYEKINEQSKKLFINEGEKELYSNGFLNTFFNVVFFVNNNKNVVKNNGDDEYTFKLDDILKYFNLDNQSKNRTSLLTLLTYWNYIHLSKDVEKTLDDGQVIKGKEILNPLKFTFIGVNPDDKKVYITLKLKYIGKNEERLLYIPEKILKINKNVFENKNTYTYGGLKIIDLLDKKEVLTLKLENLAEHLGIKVKDKKSKTKKKIEELLNNLKIEKIIFDYHYQKENDTYKILKNKFSK